MTDFFYNFLGPYTWEGFDLGLTFLEAQVCILFFGRVLKRDRWFSLRIGTGFLLGFASVACFATFIVLLCLGIEFGGLTAWLFPTIGAIGGVILVCQGLANVHTHMIYKEVQNRPKYIVSEKYNFEEKED